MPLVGRRRRAMAFLSVLVVIAAGAVAFGFFSDTSSRSPVSGPQPGQSSGSSPSGSSPPGTSSPGSSSSGGEKRGTPTQAAPACLGPGRTLIRPAGTPVTYTSQWKADTPSDDTTYDLRGVTSTAYPSKSSVFLIGKTDAALRTCVIGGTLHGHPDDSQTWQYYHDQMSGACVQIVARGWIEVRDTRCDGAEDGIRPEENALNANNATVFVSGTYLTNIRDDCIENDFTLGGVLIDNLWDGCHTGISERPCCGRSWTSPSSETLTLDHMLIGLRESPNTKPGTVVLGENSLFKWSASANHLVIKCSIFKVDAISINGTKSMAVPQGTVVDDSACPQSPSTIVWLGGGTYPAPTGGLRVVTDVNVWDAAVAAWKTAHGYPSAG